MKAGATKYCSVACYRIVQRSGSVANRFWSKVRKGGGCWLWAGSIHSNTGYGQMTVRYPDGVLRPMGAHRIAWELTRGPIPRGQWVLHSCDTPLCVNPDHLFLGTQKENMADAARKGRLSVSRPGKQTVSVAAVAHIKSLRARGWTLMDIARRFSVSKSFVSFVVRGKRRQYDAARQQSLQASAFVAQPALGQSDAPAGQTQTER